MASNYGDLQRPPLHAGDLRRALVTPTSAWSAIDVVEETASTNKLAADRARDTDADGLVVIAEHQTAGRGRLGRTWVSPARSGLTLSAVHRPDGIAVAHWPWIPLIAGLAVAAAVRHEGGLDASLKWPNDVVIADRKLAGLLVERVESARFGSCAVIGIGLNVSLRADELPVPEATSLLIEGASTLDRSVLARSILRNLGGLLKQWQQASGDSGRGLRQAYLEACSTIGRDVRVDLPGGGVLDGKATGIDAGGRLLVRTADGETALGAGDVLHTRPQT